MNKKTKKQKRKIKKQNIRNKIHTKKIRNSKGGLWPFNWNRSTTMVKNPMINSKKINSKKINSKKNNVKCNNSNVGCNYIDKNYNKYTLNGKEINKINNTWETCIKLDNVFNHILYITSYNVLIKSVETTQIPEFYLKLSSTDEPKLCKFMIDDKYVNCFLCICDTWYAIMRLMGSTLNTEYFARTEKNKVFYRLENVIFDINIRNPKIGSSNITLEKNSYEEINKWNLLSVNKTKVIKLKNGFENINKESKAVFDVLQEFRQQKMIATDVKEIVATDIVLEGLDDI